MNEWHGDMLSPICAHYCVSERLSGNGIVLLFGWVWLNVEGFVDNQDNNLIAELFYVPIEIFLLEMPK